MEPTNEDYFDAIKYIDQLHKNISPDESLINKFSDSYYQAFLTIAFKEKDFLTLFNHKTSMKCGRRFTALTAYKSSLRKKMYDLNGTPTIEVDLCASQASQLHNMLMLSKTNRESAVASSSDANFTFYPQVPNTVPADCDYLHLTSNNTIYGTGCFYQIAQTIQGAWLFHAFCQSSYTKA